MIFFYSYSFHRVFFFSLSILINILLSIQLSAVINIHYFFLIVNPPYKFNFLKLCNLELDTCDILNYEFCQLKQFKITMDYTGHQVVKIYKIEFVESVQVFSLTQTIFENKHFLKRKWVLSLKRDKNSNSGYVRNGKPDIVLKTVKGFNIKRTSFIILIQENS